MLASAPRIRRGSSMMNSFEDLMSSSHANEYIPLYNVEANSSLSISSQLHHKLYQPLQMNSTTFNTETNSAFNQDPPLYDPAMLSHHHHQYHFMPISEGLSTHVPPPITNGLVNPLSQSEPYNINNSSPPHRNYNCGGKKRKRNNNDHKDVEKPRDVVHVRARRGQATDSHSLSERSRREKINEKLRSLQDLVPGCYKTMGMAVMLDVIINYVRSLQNQIEFLSMKLSAASMFYDFNSSEMDAFETMQGTSGYEAQVLERMVGEGYGNGGFPLFDIQ